MRFEGSFHDVKPDDRLECGICWWVYDPAIGDDSRAIPSGTAFADLPADWCCPGCDAPPHKFMVLGE
jgi:rubredoxin